MVSREIWGLQWGKLKLGHVDSFYLGDGTHSYCSINLRFHSWTHENQRASLQAAYL